MHSYMKIVLRQLPQYEIRQKIILIIIQRHNLHFVVVIVI